ncbi:MAG: hypothetical protein Q8O75_00725 [bacterium]|nr:hypothetical protein [bacterium]
MPRLDPNLTLWIYGQCPNCREEDRIVSFVGDSSEEIKQAKCLVCNATWAYWLDLIHDQKAKGNQLVAVQVERQQYNGEEFGVQLTWPPKREIPCANQVVSFLNAALIARFDLEVLFATEGGIEGSFRGEYMDLRNFGHEIGLVVDRSYRQGLALREVLDFYERLLRHLFQEQLEVRGRRYQRAEILRLDPSDQHPEKVWEILVAMAMVVDGEDFAKKVVQVLQRTASSFGAEHLRGLTDEEIARFFVPPY